MARPLRVVGWMGAGLLLLLLIVAAGVTFVLETRPGHDFVLRTALRRLPDFVNGGVSIAGIRSDGLLRGFTLRGVAVTDTNGRPFVEADSLRVRYAISGLLRREITLQPVEGWGVRVTVETLHGDTLTNVQRIFPSSEEEGASGSSPGFALALRDLRIFDGELLIRLPVAGGEEVAPRSIVETPADVGGSYRIFRFTGIEGLLSEAEILVPGSERRTFAFDRLSLEGNILDEPFRLEEFRGEVVLEGSEIAIAADRLWLPRSELNGEIRLDLSEGGAGMGIEARLEGPIVSLEDFQWLEPRLPAGEGELALAFSGTPAAGELRITTGEFATARSRVRGEVAVTIGETPALLPGTELDLLAFDLEEVRPWLEEPMELSGRLSGRIRAEGTAASLRTDGSLTFQDPARGIPPTRATFQGGLRLEENLGFANFSLEIDPLRYEALRAFAPELQLEGTGSLRATLTGRLSTGITLTAFAEHAFPEQEHSRATVAGTVRKGGEEYEVELEGEVDPISLDALALALDRELPLSGEMRGTIRARGVPSDLALTLALATPAGSVFGEGAVDLVDPEGAFRFEGEVEDFLLHALLPGVPDSTRITGGVHFDGRGRDLESVEGLAALNLRASKVAGVDLERLDLRLLASGGVLRVEEMEVMAPLVRLSGTGTLPLVAGRPDGEVLIAWDAASLDVLRPLIFGSDPIATDTLTVLERETLLLEGVDLDTLGTGARTRMEGRARGEVRVTGRVDELAAAGYAEVIDLIFGETEIASGRADFVGNRSEEAWALEGVLELAGIDSHGFTFERGGGEVRLEPEGAGFSMRLDRGPEESFRSEGEVVRDSLTTRVEVETLVLELGDVTWALLEPARVRWADSTLSVESFRIARPAGVEGGEMVRIEANGSIGAAAEAPLRIEASRLELSRIERILQREDLPDGIADLQVTIGGPFAAPTMSGEFIVQDLTANGAGLTTLQGSFDYLDQRLDVQIGGEVEGRPTLALEGFLPLDLSFAEVADRIPEEEMDLTLTVQELPAGMVAVFLQGIEEVEGVFNGGVRLRGTPGNFQPEGEVLLRNGSLFLPELGVRPSAITADLRLRDDGLLEVRAESASPGTLRASGTIGLSDLRDPRFSLTMEASGFPAVQRRDLTARIGGNVTLAGSFNAPLVVGTVRVEAGEMFLEEFARSSEVINLGDQAIMDQIDTSLVAVRPIVEAAQNPFVQNLRVEVDLEIGRDFWLRSREMDVEIGGALTVTFDRPRREIVMSGPLYATRGNYSAFGRKFQVVDGTVEFFGTPGIDPALNIRAVTRFRRPGGEPLNITVNVEGTLMRPTVALSSDAQPAIAESDLIAYLIFGRPSYALASGESSVLAGAAGAGVTIGIGTLASQVGSVVAREIGLDYFTITQDQEGAGIESIAGISNSLLGTQIEMGRYVGESLFLAFTLRPVSGVGAGSRLPGARIEWEFADEWAMEGFVEDRFAREGSSGFGELGLRLSKALGVSLFREWGY